MGEEYHVPIPAYEKVAENSEPCSEADCEYPLDHRNNNMKRDANYSHPCTHLDNKYNLIIINFNSAIIIITEDQLQQVLSLPAAFRI